MVSPQPLEPLRAQPLQAAQHAAKQQSTQLLASPILEREMQRTLPPLATPNGSAGLSMPRMKRTTSFIKAETYETQPYLWALYDDLGPTRPRQHQQPPHPAGDLALSPEQGASVDSPHMEDILFSDMPPLQRLASYNPSDLLAVHSPSYPADIAASECARCWDQNATCDECLALKYKQAQFDELGWPIEPQLQDLSTSHYSPYVKQEPYADLWAMPPYNANSHLQAPPRPSPVQVNGSSTSSVPMQYTEPTEEKTSEPSLADLPPLGSPLLVGEELHNRMQGKLTRFLPEGQGMQAVDDVDPNYTTAFEHAVAHMHLPSTGRQTGRSMRERKVRSQSPSEYSAPSSPNDSAYDTDHDQYEPDEPAYAPPQHRAPRRVNRVRPLQQRPLDDDLSPPVVRYDDSSSSGQSSSEPPALNSLLPVSARDLLPSRPSTAAVPPAHIKDRLVRSAKKLLTAADGVNDSVQVQVIPIYYPSKGAANAHKIRVIRVENTEDKSVSVYAHAADVGGVVERKSNISRLFGKFESPSEKLLMNVVGAHNHQVGQESNILTFRGVKKFLATNKMKEEHTYRAWINDVLLPMLLHDPLVIGEEVLEIEASTDPNMPTVIKPKKLKRMEKKRRLAQEQQQPQQAQYAQMPSNASSPQPLSPSSKRQKLVHSPTASLQASTSPFSLQANTAPFALGLDATMRHAA